ncbi:MAG: DUF4189 domain-containing protein [Betaproteobacteria bacterium]|nr:DUF4189 domain-containing protein [Betaproteobacteria bacterium]
MKTTKLILVAAVISAAVFSQSALAYGAVWKYGGNYGFGKGVGAVADYETQKEADRDALKQCKKERPAYAAKSKWGKCRIEERFHDQCASWGRFIITATKNIPNPDAPDAALKTETKDISSVLFHRVGGDLRYVSFFRFDDMEEVVERDTAAFEPSFICQGYAQAHPDFEKNVGPGDKNDPNLVSLQTNCKKPAYVGTVCDNVGYELYTPQWEKKHRGAKEGRNKPRQWSGQRSFP